MKQFNFGLASYCLGPLPQYELDPHGLLHHERTQIAQIQASLFLQESAVILKYKLKQLWTELHIVLYYLSPSCSSKNFQKNLVCSFTLM